MKYKFESSDLAIYQIKELLKDFNLPMIPVYTDETFLYEGRTYIKGNEVVKYDGEKFNKITDYSFNRKIINLTKNLVINSSNYDTYTHRYLGDYLRFIRDYKGLDLMSMYNCFDYEQPSRIIWESSTSSNKYLNIDTTNTNFTYYLVPIKFNKIYTIAIDSDITYEMSCILYNNNFIDFTPLTLRQKSYKKVGGSKYTSPYTYDTNFFEGADSTYIKRCLDHEKDLFLLLKLPLHVNSTITVLEGNYTNFSNVVDRQLITSMKYSDNKTWSTTYCDEDGNEISYPSTKKVVSNKVSAGVSTYPASVITKNSLLAYNNHISYPFADRLVEFLLGNTIDSMDQNASNVQRVKSLLDKDPQVDDEGKLTYNYLKHDGVWLNSTRKDVYDLMNENVKNINSNKIIKRYFLDKEITNYHRRGIDINNDITGYVDKDTESYLEVS